MDSNFLLSAQVIAPDDTGPRGSNTVTVLDRSGLLPDPWEHGLPIVVLIEDRDQFCPVVRTERFTAGGLAAALKGASSVTLVLFQKHTVRANRRPGQGKHDREHAAAIGKALASGRMRAFVKTTSDRLAYWTAVTRKHAPSRCELRALDGEGVCRIVYDWRDAA